MSLPSTLNFGINKPLAKSSKPSINRFRSDNSSYNNNDTIRIEIPTNGQGQMLFPRNSFIEGSVSVNALNGATAGAIYIDQSVYALFNRMRIIHGSTVIEDCLYVNKVWTSILDVQVNDAERHGLGITHLVGDVSAGLTNAYSTGQCGTKFNNYAVNAAVADSPYFDFCFPLPSAILGTLAQKALPLGLCRNSSIYIELELASPNMAFVAEYNGAESTITLNSFTVKNIYYNAKIVTLPSDVNQELIASLGEVILLPAVAYKAEQKSFASAAGALAFNDKFSFQFSSIKSFYFFVQNTACANGNIFYRSISSRPHANINDYFLTINGEAYPSQSITGATRQYAELLRSWDQLSDTNAGGVINYTSYTQSNAHTAVLSRLTATAPYDSGGSTIQQRFLAGIDLDRFNHSSDVLMSGTSSNGQMINLQVNLSIATTDPLTLIAYVQYDVMFSISNGQITASI